MKTASFDFYSSNTTFKKIAEQYDQDTSDKAIWIELSRDITEAFDNIQKKKLLSV